MRSSITTSLSGIARWLPSTSICRAVATQASSAIMLHTTAPFPAARPEAFTTHRSAPIVHNVCFGLGPRP